MTGGTNGMNRFATASLHYFLILLPCANFSMNHKALLRSDFVASHDERHLPAPWVDKGRPAGVDGQIFSTTGAHPQR